MRGLSRKGVRLRHSIATKPGSASGFCAAEVEEETTDSTTSYNQPTLQGMHTGQQKSPASSVDGCSTCSAQAREAWGQGVVMARERSQSLSFTAAAPLDPKTGERPLSLSCPGDMFL